MHNRIPHVVWCAAALSTLVASAIAWPVDLRAAAGVLAGGAWNLASVWCLAHLLNAWLGPRPSRRRAIGWLMVKFPLLYLLVFALLRSPAISLIGFGIGFSLVLAVVVGWFALNVKRLTASPYGR